MSATAISGGSASRGAQPAAVVVSEQERHNAEDLAFDLRQMVRNGHIDEPQCRDLKEQCELEFSRWESLAQQAANREDFVEFERLTEIAHKLGDALRVYDEASRGDSRPAAVDRSASFGGQSAPPVAGPSSVTQRQVSISEPQPPTNDMPPPPSLSAEKKSRKKKKKHQRRRSSASFDDFDQPPSGGDGGAGPQSTAPPGEPSFPAFEGADAWGSVFPDPAVPPTGPASVVGGADAVPPGSGAGVGPVPEPVNTEAVEKAKALEEENADLNERIETLSRQVSVAQSGMAMLQEQLTAAQKTINRQENEHAQLVDRLGKSVQIITKLRPMQGKAEVLEERLTKANKDAATQKEQLEAKDKVIKALEAQLDSKSKLLTETRQKLFSERDRVMAMNQEIANLRVANDEVQQEADQLANRAGMREKQLQRMRYIVDASGLVDGEAAIEGGSMMPSTSMLSQVAGTAPDLRTSTGMTMRNIPYSQASLNQRQQMLAGGGTSYSIPNTTANGVSPSGDSLSRIQSQATVADMKDPLFFRPTNDMDWGRTEVHGLAQPISDQYRHMLTCGSGEYSGTIFEDAAVSVRMHCSVEGLGIDLKFELVNKGATPLVQANLIAEPRKVTAFDFTIEPVPSRSPVIMGGAKREFTGRLLVKSPYEFPPVMCISYVLSDGTPVNNYIRIPLPIPKVAKPANPSSTVFFDHWRSEKFSLCEISSRISLRNEYTQAGGLAAVANAVEFGGNFARLAGLDSTARSVVVVGVIPFDTPAEVMARVELSARHPGEARVEVRTPNVVLSRAVRNAIGEVLSSWNA